MPFLLWLYRFFVRTLGPCIRWHVYARAQQGKEDKNRLSERWGYSSANRFATAPLWVHAASVGEATAALTLIQMIRKSRPDVPIVLTTGTVTSAKIIADRLPSKTIHQYAPYDHPEWVERFLDHWQPTHAFRLESELWPTTLLALKRHHIKTALINARLSARSFSRWRFFPATTYALFSCFSMILADGDLVAKRLRSLGASEVTPLPSIKFLADAPSLSNDTVSTLQKEFGNRPVWLYASTHADEELIAARIHVALKKSFPDLLTVILPRHPDRRDEIKRTLATTGLCVAWRSKHQQITSETDLYIADTLGELMAFYAVSPVAVIGRSFSLDGGGGHNPIEAAMMGCYPLSGPHVQNLETVFDMMIKMNATEILPDIDHLVARLSDLLFMTDILQVRQDETQKSVEKIRMETENRIGTRIAAFLDT